MMIHQRYNLHDDSSKIQQRKTTNRINSNKSCIFHQKLGFIGVFYLWFSVVTLPT